MKWVQRRRAVTVRRAGRPVLCMGTRSTFGEYGGCSSAAERARQVFGRSPCRPVRVRPSHITRAVLASRAPLGRRPSVALGRRDDPTGKAKSAEPLGASEVAGLIVSKTLCRRLRRKPESQGRHPANGHASSLLSLPFVLARRPPISAVPSSPSLGAAVLARHTCKLAWSLSLQLSITDFERRPV